MRILLLFVLLTGMLGITACSTTDPAKTMGVVTRAYERAIRWGNIEAAERFRREPDPRWTPEVRKRLETIRVTSYQVLFSTIEPDEQHMSQTVRIKYYVDADIVERTLRDQQRWEYDPEVKQWYIVSDLPLFP